MNMMALRFREDIIVIAAGHDVSGVGTAGPVDLVIPDITYLKQNRAGVRAMVLTWPRGSHRRVAIHSTRSECAGAQNAVYALRW